MADKTPTDPLPFWQAKTLEEMTRDEWEQLCDGCGQCCLHKLEDTDSGRIAYTNIACHLLDCQSCRCKDYPNRQQHVPDCIDLTPDKIYQLPWLPESCAYRRIAEGRGLADWHPLVSGNSESVHDAGISIRAFAVSEADIEDPEDYITNWLNLGNRPIWVEPSRRIHRRSRPKKQP